MAAPELDAGFLDRNKQAMLLASLAISVSQGLALFGVVNGADLSGIGFAAAAGAMTLLATNRPLFGAAQPFLLAWFAAAAFVSWLLGMRLGGAVFWQELMPLGIGMGLMRYLATRAGRTRRVRIIFSCIFSAAALTAGTTFAWVGLDADIPHLPQVCDPVLYHIDALLGFSSALPLARLVMPPGVIQVLVVQGYQYLLVIALTAVFSEGLYSRKSAMMLPLQFTVSAFCAVPLYAIIPAIAPRFFFGLAAFPAHMPAAASLAAHFVLAPVATPRNTMPSMHFTWALLIWLALRDSPWWQRPLATGFIGLTILATLGFGEHYLVDLVSAFPFVLLVRALCCAGVHWRAPERWRGALFGLVALLLWVAFIFAAPWSLALPWAVRGLAAFSVVGAVVLEARLNQAERGAVLQPLGALPQAAPVLPGAR